MLTRSHVFVFNTLSYRSHMSFSFARVRLSTRYIMLHGLKQIIIYRTGTQIVRLLYFWVFFFFWVFTYTDRYNTRYEYYPRININSDNIYEYYTHLRTILKNSGVIKILSHDVYSRRLRLKIETRWKYWIIWILFSK